MQDKVKDPQSLRIPQKINYPEIPSSKSDPNFAGNIRFFKSILSPKVSRRAVIKKLPPVLSKSLTQQTANRDSRYIRRSMKRWQMVLSQGLDINHPEHFNYHPAAFCMNWINDLLPKLHQEYKEINDHQESTVSSKPYHILVN